VEECALEAYKALIIAPSLILHEKTITEQDCAHGARTWSLVDGISFSWFVISSGLGNGCQPRQYLWAARVKESTFDAVMVVPGLYSTAFDET
jgi:hypothetical protein